MTADHIAKMAQEKYEEVEEYYRTVLAKVAALS